MMESGIKLLYLSVNDWGNIGRRKPRLAHEFARQPGVASVLYVEPPIETSFLDLARRGFGGRRLGVEHAAARDALLGRVRCAEGNLWVYRGTAKTLPLTRVGAIRRLNALHQLNQRIYTGLIRRCLRRLPGNRLLVWLNYPHQAGLLDAFPERELLCYDWTDDWTAFDLLLVEDVEELVDTNAWLLREADVVFAVSEELLQQAQALNPKAARAPNATDPVVLGTANDAGPVAPQLLKLCHPIIGYIGQIADKIDYQLISSVAKARPNWSLVFVGPIWQSKQREVDLLSALPNVHFLGYRPYHELPVLLRGFDVCIMPHQCNRLTRSMDPIKLYDYLASGKPIVSTDIAGVDRFDDVVLVAKSASEFVAAIERGLGENGLLYHRRLTYAQQNAWSQRAAAMWQVVTTVMAEKGKR